MHMAVVPSVPTNHTLIKHHSVPEQNSVAGTQTTNQPSPFALTSTATLIVIISPTTWPALICLFPPFPILFLSHPNSILNGLTVLHRVQTPDQQRPRPPATGTGSGLRSVVRVPHRRQGASGSVLQ